MLTSPSQRAVRTCELAGFSAQAEIDPDLAEWDYGEYEGRRTAEILAERPDWQLFRDGAPGGESLEQIGARADRVVARIRSIGAQRAGGSRARISRAYSPRAGSGCRRRAAAIWFLSTASLSILGYEHNLAEPIIRLWNDTSHLGA